MKMGLVIGLVALFVGIAFAPCINANVSKTSVENELVEISIEICGLDGAQEKIIKLSEQDALELEVIFNDMKLKLDNVNTKQETIEIFNDAVLSLNDFGLLPSDMSIEEVQQLVTNINFNENIPNNDDENFNCFIVGKTSWTTFIKPRWDIWFSNILPLLILSNGSIAFGEECWDWNGGSGDYYKAPANGWVWTKGSNGVITWEDDSLWGNLGTRSYYMSFGEIRYEYLFYEGATGFTGIRIRGFRTDRYFGTASHVAIVTEFPGKSPPKEKPNNQITPYLSDLFLFGKISNVRRGGYTPAYWFHIDKVMTIGNQDPKVQWIEDREGFMLSMDFRGFVLKNIIIGRVSEILIYD